MAFSAPAFAIDTVRARLASDYPTVLAAVCAERGVTYSDADYPMAPAAVRATVRPEEMAAYAFPFGWVEAVPAGRVDESTAVNVRSFTSVTCFIADRHADGEVLAQRLTCHLLALIRTFIHVAGDGWEMVITDWTGTPPYAPDDLWVGSAGVQIEVQVIEALD